MDLGGNAEFENRPQGGARIIVSFPQVVAPGAVEPQPVGDHP
jgi:hypothetical protein